MAINSIILVENDMNPINKRLPGEEENAKLLVEEKMLQISQILGISVKGRMEDIRAGIREMISKEGGKNIAVQSRKKQKGHRELLSLASSINYGRASGPLRV